MITIEPKRTAMPDLFNTEESANIVQRIQKLTADSRPRWGRMNSSQMLAHCQFTFLLALGETHLRRNLFGFLFGRMAKKTLLSDKPFKRGLPTAPEFVVRDEKNFEVEKAKLISLVKRFTSAGPEGLSKDPHPFFGRMTAAEWSKSQYKHLDHHLQQFGV